MWPEPNLDNHTRRSRKQLQARRTQFLPEPPCRELQAQRYPPRSMDWARGYPVYEKTQAIDVVEFEYVQAHWQIRSLGVNLTTEACFRKEIGQRVATTSRAVVRLDGKADFVVA